MSEQLKAGDILCFYEVKNPEGNTAGMMVKESHERSIDNYVQWAKSQQITLPPGHDFHRAMWVKLNDTKIESPFVPENVPFKIYPDGGVALGQSKWWLNHIFTLYSDIADPAEEE
tara:strand:- start:1053 stop:1397 length:345 start_codon:yes stop_codon:yes gene_type:complete